MMMGVIIWNLAMEFDLSELNEKKQLHETVEGLRLQEDLIFEFRKVWNA